MLEHGKSGEVLTNLAEENSWECFGCGYKLVSHFTGGSEFLQHDTPDDGAYGLCARCSQPYIMDGGTKPRELTQAELRRALTSEDFVLGLYQLIEMRRLGIIKGVGEE